MNKFGKHFFTLLLTLIMVVSIFPAVPALAANDYPDGGWDQVQFQANVTNSSGSKIGTVYPGEGVTVLSMDSRRAYIEYSTSNGCKRGYVDRSNLAYYGHFIESGVARVKTSSSTYYSPNKSHRAGSVSSGEYVALLCYKKDGWSYIEYNMAGAQRKRAFVPSSCLEKLTENVRSVFYHENRIGYEEKVSSNTKVYAGPDNTAYPNIGTIYAGETYHRYWDFHDGDGKLMSYVKYKTDSGDKFGYIYR